MKEGVLIHKNAEILVRSFAKYNKRNYLAASWILECLKRLLINVDYVIRVYSERIRSYILLTILFQPVMQRIEK